MVQEDRMRAVERRQIAAGIGVALGGCLVLLGWAFGVEALRSLSPGLVAMNSMTTVSFILAGISLAAAQRKQEKCVG